MHQAYIDPFESRIVFASPRALARGRSDADEETEPGPDDWDPTLDLPEDEPEGEEESPAPGLGAIEDDQKHGRREAPFADDPEHRVRPAG